MGAKLFHWILAVVVVLVGYELAFRHISYVRTDWHEVLGPIIRPGSRAVWRTEGSGVTQWVENGVKAPGVCNDSRPRILVMGDSFTESLMLDQGEDFSAQLQKLVKDEFCIVNVGRSFNSIADAVAYFPFFDSLVGASKVIIQVTESDFFEDAWNVHKPHFTFTNDQIFVEVGLQRSVVYDFVGAWRRSLDSALFDNLISTGGLWKNSALKQKYFYQTEIKPSGGNHEKRLAIEMELLARTFGDRLSLFFIPPFNLLDLNSISERENLLATLANRYGIHWMSFRGTFQSFNEKKIVPFGFANTKFNSGHINRAGHHEIAKILGKYLKGER